MKKEYRFLYVLAVIKFILPFILQDHYYGPQRDEFLYLAALVPVYNKVSVAQAW
jgi:hypothetical protein